MEGNVSTDGWLSVGYQNVNTGYVTELWKTAPSVFPIQNFGWNRVVVPLKGMSETFRVIITGIPT